MAVKLKIEKGVMKFKKKSSPLKLLSQSQPNFAFIPPFCLFLAWRTSLLEIGITGHIVGRGPTKDHSTKVWLQLAQWFLKRRFVCEFPIRFYVKLSSAV
jgi:hypothetical protein